MKAKLVLVGAMLIFGSIGLFVKNIELSSSEVALFRGIIGSIFLFVASLLVKNKIYLKTTKSNIILLILSGAAIGFNWIFLFESYRYTTIPNATLSYYFAPVFVMLLAPFILKEKMTLKKTVSIIAAMIGLFLVVNTDGGSIGGSYDHIVGIGYGLLAAALYASVILMNKFIKNLSGYETTLMQLAIASIVLFPYVIFKEDMSFSGLDSQSIILLITVGIVHTGIAYLLYFSAIEKLDGQSIAVLSYVDPISAVIMATIFLHESMSLLQIIGGFFILGSTLLSDKSKPKDDPEPLAVEK